VIKICSIKSRVVESNQFNTLNTLKLTQEETALSVILTSNKPVCKNGEVLLKLTTFKIYSYNAGGGVVG
jgi:hypothetical protein